MNTPDTTQAVLEALRYHPNEEAVPATLSIAQLRFIATTTIQAHNKALAEIVRARSELDYDYMSPTEAVIAAIQWNECRRLLLGEEA